MQENFDKESTTKSDVFFSKSVGELRFINILEERNRSVDDPKNTVDLPLREARNKRTRNYPSVHK
jgi:hypothetical protein